MRGRQGHLPGNSGTSSARVWVTGWRARVAGLSTAGRRRLGYALAPVGVALVSLAIAVVNVRARIPNISVLYLLVILALASTLGRGSAVFAALLAFLAYDFFFVEPLYTFTIRDPEEWLALLVFLLTAAVAGQLTAALRERAEEARRREADNAALYQSLNQALEARAAEAQRREQISATLYELSAQSRALVAKPEPDRFLAALAARVVSIFGIRSCAILLPAAGGPLRVHRGHAAEGGSIEPLDRNEEGLAEWAFRSARAVGPTRYHHILFVPLQASHRRLGLLRVEQAESRQLGDADVELLATFAAQAALALEQARLEREAVRAEVLARADQLKDALISSVSHDLRTPLASIRAAAGSLLQEDIEWDPETRREFAAAIDEEAARLNRLVGAMLDMSRIEAGALRARKELYPLDALIRTAIARLTPLAGDRPVVLDLAADLPPIPLDPVQIDQVLTNLLENAFKYSPAGTPLTIAVALRAVPDGKDDAVQVSVTDRGPGIAPVERERVFDKFYRLGKHEGVQGSGLGLAITRGLIEAHGGRIWVEEGVGGGTRFVFSLPLLAVDGPADGRSDGTVMAGVRAEAGT